MALSTYSCPAWNGLSVVADVSAEDVPTHQKQTERIRAALGLRDGRLPGVSDETLRRYYRYLAAELPLPFQARYPEATERLEETMHQVTVLELLDPQRHTSDDFSGILCRVQKGRHLVELPLVELEVLPESAGFQLIEDYWYWFWNWR